MKLLQSLQRLLLPVVRIMIVTTMKIKIAPKIWLDRGSCNSAVYSIAKRVGTIVSGNVMFPIALKKAIKNPVEINGMKESHIRDGAAIVQYLSWLEEQMKDGNDGAEGILDEVAVADKLENLRSEIQHYKGLSFETISSSGPNGAVIHYAPTRGNCRNYQNQKCIYVIQVGNI